MEPCNGEAKRDGIELGQTTSCRRSVEALKVERELNLGETHPRTGAVLGLVRRASRRRTLRLEAEARWAGVLRSRITEVGHERSKNVDPSYRTHEGPAS